MDRVCILISSYNGEKYIGEQIESLMRQIGVNISIVIRDDGSNDSTIGIINDYMKTNKKIELYRGKNIGPAKSFFELVKIAPEAEYYAFCDQDDVWMDQKIFKAIDTIKKNSSDDIPTLYHSNLNVVDSKLNPIMKSKKSVVKNKYTCLVDNNVTGCTVVLNRALLKLAKSNQPDSIIMHDSWLNIIASFFGKVIFDDEAYIYYRQHERNVIGMHERTDIRQSIISGVNRLKRIELQPRLQNATNFYKTYESMLSEEDKKQLLMIINYKRSFFDRMKLLLNYKIRSDTLEKDIKYRLLILAGEI